jgi:hypothetical protein
MTRTPRRPRPEPVSRAVNIRLMGHPDDLVAVATHLSRLLGVEPAAGPYPNRREPGHRLYLTVHVHRPPSGRRGASAQPPSNPPAPRSLEGDTPILASPPPVGKALAVPRRRHQR